MAPDRGAIRKVGRRILFYAIATFVFLGAGASVTWVYREAIFRFLFIPAGGNLSPFGGLPIFTSPMEPMSATFGLAMKGGLIAAAPVFVFSIYRLLRPLMDRERRRFLTWFLPVMGLFYLGGAAFAYYVMLPKGMQFLLNFGDGIAIPMITLTAYMSLVTALIFWLGIVFEIPLVMFLLAKLRLVSHTKFKKLQKYLLVAAPALAMFITPTTDPYNQAMVAVPIVVLYEVGVFLAWLARPSEGGSNLNPLRWPLIRNLWTLIVSILLVLAVGVPRGLWEVGGYTARVTWSGGIRFAEQDRLAAAAAKLIALHLRLARKLGVEVDR